VSKPKPNQGLAWSIACDNDLEVVIVVAGKCILLNSKESSGTAPWRLGYYPDSDEAHLRAVEMTGSYERLRAGKVSQPVMVTLPEKKWVATVESGTVDDQVIEAVLRALTRVDLTDD
jgi:hypothetical protein